MDPVVLFFALGVIARLARSDLRIPSAVYDLLSILLLLTIGLKGGVELARAPFSGLAIQAAAVLAMGFALPLLLYPIARRFGRFGRADAGSLAAHYGSVSVATFAVGLAYLAQKNVSHDSQLPLFLVLLEVPAVIVGVMLARRKEADGQWGRLFFDLFKGVLALFLLEMGLIAAGQVQAVRERGAFLVAFGILAPIPLGVIGALVGWSIGLTPGGTMLLAVLAGSASYIAAPAAIRIALPEANPSLSLTASLGVTFPFNIFVGIPVYYWIATTLHDIAG